MDAGPASAGAATAAGGLAAAPLAAAASVPAAARPLDGDRPFLPRGVRVRFCEVRQAWFLLGPERALRLDGAGAAVLGAVDGARSFAEIAAKLAADYAAPPERIAADARKFLGELYARRLVEVA